MFCWTCCRAFFWDAHLQQQAPGPPAGPASCARVWVARGVPLSHWIQAFFWDAHLQQQALGAAPAGPASCARV